MFKDRRSLAPSQRKGREPCRRRAACKGKHIISDAHEGLKAAIAQVFKAS
jgi:hypothetical protein